MGNSESVPIEGSSGFHVQENSPGHLAGLEAYFDFLVAVNNKRLDQDDESFKEILKQNIDRPLELTVYNRRVLSSSSPLIRSPSFSKTQTVRQTQIIPSNNWGGQGILGVSIRFCSFEGANQNVWHVISVQPNSPAAQAGLIGDSDYILGAESVLQHADDLISLVQANIGKQVKLFVYNVDSDNVREVNLTPNDNWGGEGCLGCDIGYGYLHRIPVSVDRSKPVQAPPVANLPPPQQAGELPKVPSSVALPGFTGIPQVDRINQPPASQPTAEKNFPSPDEFLVSLPSSQPSSQPYSQPTSQFQPPPPLVDSSPAPPSFHHSQQQSAPAPSNGTHEAPSAVPPASVYNPPTVAAPATTEPVKSEFFATAGGEAAQPHVVNATLYGQPTPPVSNYGQWNQPPTSQPPAHQPHYFMPNPEAQPPQQPPPQEQQQQSPVPPIPTSQFYGQNIPQAPGSPPISSSTYQPYLQYGAPPPTSYAPYSPPNGQQPPASMPPTSYQPMNYGQPQQNYAPQPPASSFAPTLQFNNPAAPPPFFNSLPMPDLSTLGINELVHNPHAQQPQQHPYGLQNVPPS
ncbi:hypothetical protein M3Y99_00347400 [Aphelenchoides fujianensis]|nr:hypothetical protein M3Y99_00347400 [Aphelenchoides fujianensis]